MQKYFNYYLTLFLGTKKLIIVSLHIFCLDEKIPIYGSFFFEFPIYDDLAHPRTLVDIIKYFCKYFWKSAIPSDNV